MNGRTAAKLFLLALIYLPAPVLGQTEGPRKVVAAAPGRIEGSADMISIGAAINGTVERVEAQQGDRVTSGQTLVRIVCDDLRARLAARISEREATEAVYRKLVNGARKEEREIAQHELFLAEARLAEAEARFKRSSALTLTNSVSVSVRDVDDRDAHMAAAQREVARSKVALLLAGTREEELAEAKAKDAAADRAVEEAKAELEKCNVKSPVSGIVLRKNVSEGELITIYYPKPLLVVTEAHGYRVRAEVDEYDVPHVWVGQPVDVVVFPKSQVRLRGSVTKIAPVMGRRQILTADPADKSDRDVVEVLIALENKPETVPIGLRVSVLFFD